MGGKKKKDERHEIELKRKQKEKLNEEMDILLAQQQNIINHLANRQQIDRKRQKGKAGAIYQKNIDADDKDVSFDSDEKQARSVMTSSDDENEADGT